MKKLFLLSLILSSPIFAEDYTINKSCTSTSGLSIYDISINTEVNSTGEIRYRFMEQDIFYRATVLTKENNILMGIAEFLESRTGESKGSSWIFSYDIQKQILKDNENIEASCK